MLKNQLNFLVFFPHNHSTIGSLFQCSLTYSEDIVWSKKFMSWVSVCRNFKSLSFYSKSLNWSLFKSWIIPWSVPSHPELLSLEYSIWHTILLHYFCHLQFFRSHLTTMLNSAWSPMRCWKSVRMRMTEKKKLEFKD